jgi:hypothetical protein
MAAEIAITDLPLLGISAMIDYLAPNMLLKTIHDGTLAK